MPEAVKVYVQTKNGQKVAKVHRSIVDTYKDDFSKYKTKMGVEKIASVFELLPGHLGKKIKYSEILKDEKSTTVNKIIDLFAKARIIHRCFHTNAMGIPLEAQKDESVFKLYFLDIGLLHHMLGLLPEDLLYEIPGEQLLTEGLAAEQFVAQHLAFAHGLEETPKLFYWLKDKKNKKAELDFVISHGKKIFPVEVKSGKSGGLKSLFYFVSTHSSSKAIRFDVKERTEKQTIEPIKTTVANQEKRQACNFTLLNIPIYLAEKVLEIVKE